MLLVFQKFTSHEVEQLVHDLGVWFAEHPDRDVCHTDLFDVRRDHIREDIIREVT